MDAEENLFGRTRFYGWTQKKIFLGVQYFADCRQKRYVFIIHLTKNQKLPFISVKDGKCRDKATFNMAEAREKIENGLKHNFYWQFREWSYKNVKPRIIAEKYLSEVDSSDTDDYKVMCFENGPEMIQVHKNRFTNHTEDFYDLNWKKMDITQDIMPNSDIIVEKPETFDDMVNHFLHLLLVILEMFYLQMKNWNIIANIQMTLLVQKMSGLLKIVLKNF